MISTSNHQSRSVKTHSADRSARIRIHACLQASQPLTEVVIIIGRRVTWAGGARAAWAFTGACRSNIQLRCALITSLYSFMLYISDAFLQLYQIKIELQTRSEIVLEKSSSEHYHIKVEAWHKFLYHRTL